MIKTLAKKPAATPVEKLSKKQKQGQNLQKQMKNARSKGDTNKEKTLNDKVKLNTDEKNEIRDNMNKASVRRKTKAQISLENYTNTDFADDAGDAESGEGMVGQNEVGDNNEDSDYGVGEMDDVATLAEGEGVSGQGSAGGIGVTDEACDEELEDDEAGFAPEVADDSADGDDSDATLKREEDVEMSTLYKRARTLAAKKSYHRGG